MAQLVLIDTGTLRYVDGKPINAIGDVVAIHDDDVSLTGSGYANFKIIRVPGTAEEIRRLLESKLPTIRRVYRHYSQAGEWTFDPPEEAEAWNDGGTWRKIEKRPKYQINITVNAELENQMKAETLESEKLALLSEKVRANIAIDELNQTIITIR